MSSGSRTDVNNQFLEDVVEGLTQEAKTLPCKYFYDDRGSQLFERICESDEYYVTRTELSLLEAIKEELAEAVGKKAAIVEPGAGAGLKIQTLLAALDEPELYVPMDISEDFLLRSEQIIKARFPNLKLMPLQVDFTEWFEWPVLLKGGRRVVFFPGSTLGNFDPDNAEDFLRNMKRLMGGEGAMIIGIDLIKPVDILENAYNDRKGVTEAFNKNILLRINRELGGDFKVDNFTHSAFYNAQKKRIEMHLKSNVDQPVRVNGHRFTLLKEERIHTENSYKYSVESFQQLAQRAGLQSTRYWVDANQLFSIHLLEPV